MARTSHLFPERRHSCRPGVDECAGADKNVGAPFAQVANIGKSEMYPQMARARPRPMSPRFHGHLKAPEDGRSPKRFANSRPVRAGASFWTAPALWRFGQGGRLVFTNCTGPGLVPVLSFSDSRENWDRLKHSRRPGGNPRG